MLKNYFLKKQKARQNKTFTVGAVLGGVIGVLAAIFLTPFTGKEAREKAVTSAKKGTDWVKKEGTLVKNKAKETGEKIITKGKDLIEKAKKQEEPIEEKK